MKDTDWVMYTFNMLELQKKEKEDAKNKIFEEPNEGKLGKDQEGSLKKTLSKKQKQETIHGDCKMQIGQIKWNEGSNSKPSTKEKDVDCHVQQEELENIMLCPNIIDLTIKKTKSNEGSNSKPSMKEKDVDCHVQQEELENIMLCPNIIDLTIKKTKWNEGSNSKPSMKVKNIDCYVQQEELEKTMLCPNIIDLTSKTKWNEESNSKSSTKEKDVDCHVKQEESKNTMLCPNIIDLTIMPLDKKNKKTYKEVTPNEKNEIKEQKDQDESFKEEIPQNQHQQQKEHDINDEFELNRVTCENSLPNNSNCNLNDSNANYGSKLWTRDVIDGKYHITQGIPGSKKFRSITNLYECTNRISSIEDEYNWNLATKEDLNMDVLKEEYSSIITNHKGIGCKRQWRENQKASGEKDATTSST